MDTIAQFGGAQNLLAQNPLVTRDARGRYYAVGVDRMTVLVFDSTGKMLTRFGKGGAGPGEFNGRVSGITVAPGDTIVVADASGRASVFSPEYSYVRTHRLRASQPVALPGGLFFLGEVRVGAGRVEQPFHVIDGDGNLVRSFGRRSIGMTLVPNTPTAYFAMTKDYSALWHWASREYRIEEWNLAGERLRTLYVDGHPYLNPQLPINRAGVMIVGGIDSEGLLWVNLLRPPQIPGRAEPPVIEVVDTRANTLLLSMTMPSQVHLLSGTDLARSISSNSGSGDVIVVIRRLKVARVQ
jgi:hypothetical protein